MTCMEAKKPFDPDKCQAEVEAMLSEPGVAVVEIADRAVRALFDACTAVREERAQRSKRAA